MILSWKMQELFYSWPMEKLKIVPRQDIKCFPFSTTLIWIEYIQIDILKSRWKHFWKQKLHTWTMCVMTIILNLWTRLTHKNGSELGKCFKIHFKFVRMWKNARKWIPIIFKWKTLSTLIFPSCKNPNFLQQKCR